jgi:hypothetical protein
MLRAMKKVFDEAERERLFNFRIGKLIARLPPASSKVLGSAFRRQIAVGRLIRVSAMSDHVVLVPNAYISADEIPFSLWLDSFLTRTLHMPYYVGLLSAAAIYGAIATSRSQLQVVGERRHHPVIIRAQRVLFSTGPIANVPKRRIHSPYGSHLISTPEVTCLDLARVRSPIPTATAIPAIAQLLRHCSPSGMRRALDAFPSYSRATVLYEIARAENHLDLAKSIRQWVPAGTADTST